MCTQITAHSGCEASPENSVQHVQNAIAAGADILEVDVRLLEGELILSHDRTDAKNRLKLQELFELAKASTIRFNLDLKEDGLEMLVVQQAAEAGMCPRVILTGSVDPALVAQLQQQVQVSLNIEQILPTVYINKNVDALHGQCLQHLLNEAERWQVHSLNLCYLFWNEELDKAAGERGISLSLWTVDTEESLKKLLAQSPWNITTRFPVLAKQLLHQIQN